MKFWKRLRWAASIAFVAALLLSWLASEGDANRNNPSKNIELRAAPTFNR